MQSMTIPPTYECAAQCGRTTFTAKRYAHRLCLVRLHIHFTAGTMDYQGLLTYRRRTLSNDKSAKSPLGRKDFCTKAVGMALKGVKVLELAGLAPGPFCGMILSDFGASVIRVDKMESLYNTDVLGNGKRSIALNLKTEEGIKIFRELSNQSDVLIDPFRKGVMEKLQLGPEVLMEANKKLIYARLSGFGHKGPYADMAGHDINYVALSGLLSLFGRANEKPIPPVNFAADFAGGGLICAFGILLALYERTRSSLGQVVDSSMVEGTAYIGSWLFRSQRLPIWGKPRGENMLDTGCHFYDTYETKDKRYMAVGAIEPRFYNILIAKLGFSYDQLPQFEHSEENREKLAEKFRSKTQKEWCEIFDGTDACVTPVVDAKDAPFQKHNKERETFTVTRDNLAAPNPAPRLSRTPALSTSTLSKLVVGEHTIEILSELGYQSGEIAGFMSKKIVLQGKRLSTL